MYQTAINSIISHYQLHIKKTKSSDTEFPTHLNLFIWGCCNLDIAEIMQRIIMNNKWNNSVNNKDNNRTVTALVMPR